MQEDVGRDREPGRSVPPGQSVRSFYAGPGAKNGCAQAAVAWLLTYWGRSPYLPGADLVQEVYRRYPPDTPFALFGTTPGRLERACRGYGLETARWWGAGAEVRLRKELGAGRPVVVLLDLARLEGPFGLHYVVACGGSEEAVFCANMLPTARFRAPEEAVPWEVFMRAWRTWLPAGRFQRAAMAAW